MAAIAALSITILHRGTRANRRCSAIHYLLYVIVPVVNTSRSLDEGKTVHILTSPSKV